MITPPAPASRLARPALLAALAALVLAAYAQSFSVPFLLDDVTTIPANASIRQLWPLGPVLFPPPEVYSAGRPLLNLSFALNYALGGTAVRGYHIANLAIHLAGTLVLFGVLSRVFLLPWLRERFGAVATPLAGLIAAAWALHPVQTISVTYLSQRAESLMGFFYLLTFYCFLRGVQQGRRAWLGGAVAACAAAMATKEVAVTAPLAVFLLDWQQVTRSLRETWRQRRAFYLCLGGTWLFLAALMLGSRLGARAVGAGQGLSTLDYLRLECQAITHYLRVAYWPEPLVFDFGADLPLPAGADLMARAAVVLALLAVVAIGLWRKQRWAFAGALFFLLLAPTSSVVPVAGQPIAENRMYLPLACALALALAAGCRALAPRGIAAGVIASLALASLAFARNAVYRDELALWRDTVAKQPVNVRAGVYYSNELRRRGKDAEALAAMEFTARQKPRSAELQNNLGVMLSSVGRIQEAKEHFQNALRLKPNNAEAAYNYGVLLYTQGDFAAALACLRESLRINPRSSEALNYAGICCLRLGDAAGAIGYFEAALQLDPQNPTFRGNLDIARGQKR